MIDRRAFLLSGLALAATAACGGDGPSPSAAPSGASSEAGYPRSVEHELGTTTLESAPERVVCGTDGGELCSLLALGVRPVGYGKRNDPQQPWLDGLTDGLDSYDLSGAESDFERLAIWRPDLLLVQTGFVTDENLRRYEGLAPTVATSFIDWRENLRQVGQAVGRQERAVTLEAEKDAAVAAAAARLGSRAAGFRTNWLTAFDDGSVYVLNDRSPVGKLAAPLGLAPLPAQRTGGEAVEQVSLEQLGTLDADLLVLLHFGGSGAGRDATDELRESAVFGTLSAARAGRVVDLDEAESEQAYFDSVLTVEPNTALLERLVTGALA